MSEPPRYQHAASCRCDTCIEAHGAVASFMCWVFLGSILFCAFMAVYTECS